MSSDRNTLFLCKGHKLIWLAIYGWQECWVDGLIMNAQARLIGVIVANTAIYTDHSQPSGSQQTD